jgi:hypothetical protein
MADPFPRAGAPSLDLGLPALDWTPPGFGAPLPGIAELSAATGAMGRFLPAYPLWKPIKVELPVDLPPPPPEPERPKLDPAEIEWKRQDLILVGQIIDILLNWEREVFFHIRGEVIARTKVRLFDDEAPSPVSTDYHPSQSVSAPVDAEAQAYWDEQNRQSAQRAEARRAAVGDDAASAVAKASAAANSYLRHPGEVAEAWQHRLFDAFGALQPLLKQNAPAAIAGLTQLRAAIEADPDFQSNANAYAQSIDPAFYADPAAWVRAHGLPASALRQLPPEQVPFVYPEDSDPISGFVQSNGNPFTKIAANGKVYDISDILTSAARRDFLKSLPPIATIYQHASLELSERTADLSDTLIAAVTTSPALGLGERGSPAPIFTPPRLQPRAAEDIPPAVDPPPPDPPPKPSETPELPPLATDQPKPRLTFLGYLRGKARNDIPIFEADEAFAFKRSRSNVQTGANLEAASLELIKREPGLVAIFHVKASNDNGFDLAYARIVDGELKLFIVEAKAGLRTSKLTAFGEGTRRTSQLHANLKRLVETIKGSGLSDGDKGKLTDLADAGRFSVELHVSDKSDVPRGRLDFLARNGFTPSRIIVVPSE